jgi:minor extracellular serine protease Vpr
MTNQFVLTLALLGSLGFTASCQKNRSNQNSSINETAKASFAISERVQQYDQYLSLIQLKEKPLLQVQYENGARGTIDQAHKVKILREQNEMIKKLQAITPDIKIVYRYQKVINALAIVVPRLHEEAIEKLQGVNIVEREGLFDPISPVEIMDELDPFEVSGDADQGLPNLTTKNSTSFIGALKAQSMGFNGKKIKVGVVDTGIDFIHKMMGGPGTEEAYKENKLDQANQYFPNDKVVGGIDLVGKDYSPGSPIFANTIPKPDDNPFDEGGHGTHVAGSVAGIGDGVNTYNGVAPLADLYAIKVFGAGSVGDSVVIKALEYAADPDGDFDLSDQLDVVNLSLGSSYGGAHLLYRKAIRNLALAGTVVVASAGNSGHTSYITGSPGSTEEAISVAASIDDMDHNIKKLATVFETPSKPHHKARSEEGAINKKLKDSGDVTGVLVDAGMADTDFSQDLKDALNGNIALISRGNVSFIDKLNRAVDAGAIAAVVFNNRPGGPIVMGGEGEVSIPAVMVDQETGTFLLKEMESADVKATLSANAFIFQNELIDTLTGFSSRGPRIGDALLKPEISAPGFNIISAAVGSGDKATRMSGTSMSAPHMAGVMALMKERAIDIEAKLGRHLTNQEMKAMVMNHTRRINDASGSEYPVAQQGAGRVQIHKSVLTQTLATPSSLSLGQHFLDGVKTIEKQITVLNLKETGAVDYTISFEGNKAISLVSSNTLSADALNSSSMTLEFEIDAQKLSEYHNELDGFVQIASNGETVAHIPVLMIATKVAGLEVTNSSATTKHFNLSVSNYNDQDGKAMVFNYLGSDSKVVQNTVFDFGSEMDCDLKTVGYRLFDKEVKAADDAAGTPAETTKMMEIAYELHDSRNSFQPCELITLIDADADDIPDYELIGTMGSNMGLETRNFTSMLFNAKKMRQARRAYEQSHIRNLPKKINRPDYLSALVGREPMDVYINSSIAVVRFEIGKLELEDDAKELNVRVLIDRNNARNSERDDYLGNHFYVWEGLKLEASELPIRAAQDITVPFAGSETVQMERGSATGGKYLVLLPENVPGKRSSIGDVK